MSPLHLLANPSVDSPRRIKANETVRAALRLRGHHVINLEPESIDAIAPTVADARNDGLTRLIVAGGDGLLHHALPALAGSDIPVGIVPVGTGNDFARALGLPSKIEPAVDAALGPVTRLDLISATNGRWAATVVTGGFSGRVNARANDLNLPIGQQRYTVATLMELAKLEPLQLELTVDDEVHHLETSLFAIGNSRFFGGGMAICPLAVPSDGQLDVTVVGPTSKFELARVLPTVFSGRHIDHKAVSIYRGRRVKVTVATDLWADGEPFADADGPTTTSLMATPSALRIAGSLVGT